jgi:hypothetical protein
MWAMRWLSCALCACLTLVDLLICLVGAGSEFSDNKPAILWFPWSCLSVLVYIILVCGFTSSGAELFWILVGLMVCVVCTLSCAVECPCSPRPALCLCFVWYPVCFVFGSCAFACARIWSCCSDLCWLLEIVVISLFKGYMRDYASCCLCAGNKLLACAVLDMA